MNYKCTDCGHIFEDGEQKVVSEYMGECHGTQAYQDFSYCPSCGSEFYERAAQCTKCFGSFLEGELTEGLCDGCLNEIAMEYKYDIAKCYALSQKSGDTDTVKVDWFLSCMFSESEINDILYRELAVASALKLVDCTAFIEADRYWFNERISEEVKNNENCKDQP